MTLPISYFTENPFLLLEKINKSIYFKGSRNIDVKVSDTEIIKTQNLRRDIENIGDQNWLKKYDNSMDYELNCMKCFNGEKGERFTLTLMREGYSVLCEIENHSGGKNIARSKKFKPEI